MTKPRQTYSEKLKDPRWQKRRLEVLQRDNWACQRCTSTTKTLHVHHRFYQRGGEPWDSPNEALVTLCEDCHLNESETRSRHEEYLIQVLRERVLAVDVYALAETIGWMPPDVFDSFTSAAFQARTQRAEEWLREKRIAFEEWERQYDARNKSS